MAAAAPERAALPVRDDGLQPRRDRVRVRVGAHGEVGKVALGLAPLAWPAGRHLCRPAHARALLPAQATPPVSSVAMRGFSLAAIAVLVYHRQKETLRLCRVPVPHWLGRAGPSD